MAKENYQPVKPNDEGIAAIERVRAKFIELDELMHEMVPPGGTHEPETNLLRAITLTELESASHFAVKAVTRAYRANR